LPHRHPERMTHAIDLVSRRLLRDYADWGFKLRVWLQSANHSTMPNIMIRGRNFAT
jgi:hypothetical protein